MARHLFILTIMLCSGLLSIAQTSSLQGIVLDQQSETPLIGVTIKSIGLDPALGAITDAQGRFSIKNVPVGRIVMQVSYPGYETQTVPNILVNSGKVVQLDLRLQESFTQIGEVVISAKTDKDRPMNELATISARQFNKEEVSRYSGGRNDVAKLVANFAGVAANNDSRNDIIIRGNSPVGVLWRVEGIPIPNPNHFATLGTTGGPVSALNPNLMSNSDFLTSAFPAEYGNALAGVFDINFRTGNKERYEFTGQMGAFTGMEAMIEGPLMRKRQGSFVAAYRHSFVELADAAGIAVGTTALPKYKDFTFNADLGGTGKSRFSVFGIFAHSSINFIGSELDSTDLWAPQQNENAYNTSLFGVTGIKHNFLLNDHSYFRTIVSGAFTGVRYRTEVTDELDENNQTRENLTVRDDYYQWRISSFYNNKINSRLTLRTGILLQPQQLSTLVKERINGLDNDGNGIPDWVTHRDFEGNFFLSEAYIQTQYRMSPRFTLNTGLHAQHFDFNKQAVAEPRVALNWQVSSRSRVNLGYGLHHQTQPLPVFLLRKWQNDGTSVPANEDLKFTRNQHWVLGYEWKPLTDWRVKAETYYQWLDQVPVDAFSSSFSMLNTGADFVFPEKTNLVNEGKGYNVGIELTAEKFFSKGYYGLMTLSLFESRYKGSDNVWRNTAFNGNYVFNILAGKEIELKKGRRYITFDTKLTTAGGRPYTPVDLNASRLAGKEILQDDVAFSERMDNYLRWDVKLGYRLNSVGKKFSQTFFLDFQNVTNHKNIFALRYNPKYGQVGRVDQIGFFPDIMYRAEF